MLAEQLQRGKIFAFLKMKKDENIYEMSILRKEWRVQYQEGEVIFISFIAHREDHIYQSFATLDFGHL